jgi:hypothetical protein
MKISRHSLRQADPHFAPLGRIRFVSVWTIDIASLTGRARIDSLSDASVDVENAGRQSRRDGMFVGTASGIRGSPSGARCRERCSGRPPDIPPRWGGTGVLSAWAINIASLAGRARIDSLSDASVDVENAERQSRRDAMFVALASRTRTSPSGA